MRPADPDSATETRAGPPGPLGFEWRTRASLFGLPLVHIALGFSAAGRPRVARGVVAIGQFAYGFVTVAQFGAGVISLTQFGLGIVTVSQFGVGAWIVAQFGFGLLSGSGPFVG